MSRKIELIITASDSEDGAGVKLKRVFSSHYYQYTNPFIMLDEFGSNEPHDYLAGFPSHPHKGFDTITFMLKGKMEHKDSLGNKGVISDHDVQWMHTGRGIIHSEMPAQTNGEMRGLQFWLNIPKALKKLPANYIDYETSTTKTHQGNTLRLIAGKYNNLSTPFQPEDTDPIILFVEFDHHEAETIMVPKQHNVLIYVLEGSIKIGNSIIKKQQLGITSTNQDSITIDAPLASKIIIFGGHPIDEPMIQHGPFVMNSFSEIQEAFTEYHTGTLGK